MPARDDDWRLRGQESYLMDAELVWIEWTPPPPGRAWRLANGSIFHSRGADVAPPEDAVEEVAAPQWDHDHCDFCWARFGADRDDGLSAGYVPTGARAPWICPTCFDDFRERFGWTVAA